MAQDAIVYQDRATELQKHPFKTLCSGLSHSQEYTLYIIEL